MKAMKRNCILAVVFVLVLAYTGKANDITYDVNVTYDPLPTDYFTVKGSITTDGTIGKISDANILSWSLTLTDPNGTTTLQSGVAGDFMETSPYGSPNDLTASSTQLLFNFSA